MKRSLIALLLLAAAGAPAAPAPKRSVSFIREVAPILTRRCIACHGERSNQGGYRAHTYRALLGKGVSGLAAVVPGKPESSHLMRLVLASNPGQRMPKQDDPLTAVDVALLRDWIAAGARFDGADPAGALTGQLPPRRHPAAPAAYTRPVPVTALAFSPDGRLLATGGYHEVLLWNPSIAGPPRRLPGLPQRIHALSFSGDGGRLLVAGGSPGEYGEVCLVEVATGRRAQVLDTLPDLALAAAFSPDGTRVAAAGADASVRLYSLPMGRREWKSQVHSDWVTDVSFSPDGKLLASSSKDLTVKVHEVTSGSLFTTYNGHNRQIGQYRGQSPVYAVRFTGQGNLACSAGGGRWLQLWDPVKARDENGDAADMEERFARQGHARYIEHGFKGDVFAVTLAGDRLFAAGAEGVVAEFDPMTLKQVRILGKLAGPAFALRLCAATGQVAAAGLEGTVVVWDLSGKELTRFRAVPVKDRPVASIRGPATGSR